MKCRGVRGATTVTTDTEKEILEATKELLTRMVKENAIATEDIASVFFTTTADLTSTFPAKATRSLGWEQVALLGAREADAPGPTHCIRVLIHWNTDRTADELRHIYLHEAVSLRPDLSAETVDKPVS